MSELTLERKGEVETENGVLVSATFKGEIGGNVEVSMTLKGDSSILNGYLTKLFASEIGDVVNVEIQKNKQSKL